MNTAFVNAGIAVLGAGLLVVTPITSPPPATTTATMSVRLAAAPAPLEFYREVAQRSASYSASLAQRYFSDPVPISRAIINNQAAAVSNIIAAVGSGDPAAVLSALGEAITQPIENTIKAAGAVNEFAVLIAGSAISPAVQLLASAGYAVGDVFAAIVTLHPLDLVNSVIDIPAHLVNGVLNGGYGYAALGPFMPLYAGVLTPPGFMITVPGPVATQILVAQRVAQAISPDSATSAIPQQRPAATSLLNTAATESGSPDPTPEPTEPNAAHRTERRPQPGRQPAPAVVDADAPVAADIAIDAQADAAIGTQGAVGAQASVASDAAVDAQVAVGGRATAGVRAAVASDAAVDADAAPEAPTSHPAPRRGHRGQSATPSKLRTQR